MIKSYLRRLFARLGIEVHPAGAIAEVLAKHDRLAEEAHGLRRTERDLTDERQRLRAQIDELHRAYSNEIEQMARLRAGPLAGAISPEKLTDDRHPYGQPFDSRERIIHRLRSEGITLGDTEPVFLHVGFGHSGTTSLQMNFFARRPDLYYLGTPYDKAGGLLSSLKYVDDYLLDEPKVIRWCREVVYDSPDRRGRPIVISDETLCDTSEVYYAPRHLANDAVAARLKCCFPTAKILFTIRNQADYISSLYFNLKRNYAFLGGVRIPPFDEWWEGMHTQVRHQYLQNLDYYPLIDHYGKLFGRENLIVLTLEELKKNGSRAYLEKLCRFMNLELRIVDVDEFSTPRNQRMTVVESRLAELVTSGVAEWSAAARELMQKESLAFLTEQAPRLTTHYTDRQQEAIRQAVAGGNKRLAEEFNLPLREWGYSVE